MTPNLPEEMWLHIFSFCTEVYSQVYLYGKLSFYFTSIVDKFLETNKRPLYAGLITYHPYDPNDSFWNGLDKHFPIWNASMTPGELFVNHICKSLDSFSADRERTDRIIFYLGKNKTFMPGHDFQENSLQYKKSMRKFIWENLSNPILYGYLELRRMHPS